MGVTIKDIAKIAGVSHSTVSRALNGQRIVSDVTRLRVQSVAEMLGYTRHRSARSLRSGKKYMVGMLILHDIFQDQYPPEFLTELLAGMTPVLNENGYHLSLFFEQVGGRKNQIPPELLSKTNVDGLFVLSMELDSLLALRIANIDAPVVLINDRVPGLEVTSVIADDEGGAFIATTHLLDLGHRKIAFIEGDPRRSHSLARKKGFISALMHRGIKFESGLSRVGMFDQFHGYEAMRELLLVRRDFTAVFASNDYMAIGAIRAMKQFGIRIPDDIAIVGFDDIQIASIIEPPLTTVRKPRLRMGEAAVNLMFRLFLNPPGPSEREVVLSTELIVRNSTLSSKPPLT